MEAAAAVWEMVAKEAGVWEREAKEDGEVARGAASGTCNCTASKQNTNTTGNQHALYAAFLHRVTDTQSHA